MNIRQGHRVNILLFVAFVVLLSLTGATSSSAGKAERKALKEALREIYTLTKTSIDELRVTRPGTVLVIQQEGIAGNPSSEVMDTKTVVEDGQIRQARGPFAALAAKESTRIFHAGERVYMTHISIGGYDVMFNISSVDTHDVSIKGSTQQVRYNGTVVFRFPADQLQSMSAEDIKAAVDTVLRPQEEADQPQTIEIGQSIEDIEAILGKPDRIVKAGSKTIYIYPDLKIIFINGSVAEVE